MKKLLLIVLGIIIGFVLYALAFVASLLFVAIVSDVSGGTAGLMHYLALGVGLVMCILGGIHSALKEAVHYGTDEKAPK
ncbi:hypothetical protein [Paenibacillus pinihumi]|uniref:hypothetical protein n=1 Tax=Paenibacillus pinihumi TaxID=669462 RepID=UPI0004042DD4|nr:hypothetical protein [Paenibacillus pinihumi]